MKLKSRLRHLLDRHDLTAAQLSRKAGVSQQVISSWLRGAEPKKVTQVKLVADALNVSMDSLCFGDKDVDKEDTPDLASNLNNEYFTGLFEVKIRRIKPKKGE